jgi:hypothetical protein
VPTIFFNNIYIIQKTKLPLVNLLIKKKLIWKDEKNPYL